MQLQTKKFKRSIEDFICKNCGLKVRGNGYTNHCPNCLWSRHVDLNPGDRKAQCHGMMRPISLEKQGDSYIIIHKCQVCGHIKRNKSAPEDNFENLIKI